MFFQQLRWRESDLGVLEARLLQRCDRLATRILGAARIHAVLDGAALRLAGKAVGRRLHGTGLEYLLFKLQLHRFLFVIPSFQRNVEIHNDE